MYRFPFFITIFVSMTLLELNLNLPDHSNELQALDTYMGKLKKRLTFIVHSRRMSDSDYSALYEDTTKALMYVGELSNPLFDLSIQIEEEYFRVYKHTPELAKTLWQQHYTNVHRPYNLFKNRLYRLYEEIDDTYKKFNKRNPPEEI